MRRIDVAYEIPPGNSPDSEALSVLGTIMAGRAQLELQRGVVRQKQLAPNVAAGAGVTRGPGLFTIVGIVTPGRTLDELEAAIDEEIDTVKGGPIADWEIEKARTVVAIPRPNVSLRSAPGIRIREFGIRDSGSGIGDQGFCGTGTGL